MRGILFKAQRISPKVNGLGYRNETITGKTLCAVLQLLQEAGIDAEDVTVMVVAEFPAHRGRESLRRHGFGGAKIQSLLVFDGFSKEQIAY